MDKSLNGWMDTWIEKQTTCINKQMNEGLVLQTDRVKWMDG